MYHVTQHSNTYPWVTWIWKNINTFTGVSCFLADERFDVGSFGCDEIFIGDETLSDETQNL